MKAINNFAILALSVILITTLTSSIRAQSGAETFQKIQKSYATALDKIATESSIYNRTALGAYLKALNGLRSSMQKAGNLEGIITIEKEIARFKDTRTLTDEHILQEPQELKDLQNKHKASIAAGSLGKYRNTISLCDKYTTRLESLKKKLTMSNDIDTALKAKKEIERVKSSAEVTEAKFQLAAMDNAPKAEKPSDSKPKTSAKASTKPKTDSQGVTVFPLGMRPATEQGVRFSRLSLKPTRKVKMSSLKASVNASSSSHNAGTRKSTSSYGYSSRKSSVKQTSIRLQVKPSKSDMILENVTVVANSYAKASGASGKIAPSLLTCRIIKLSSLDKRGVYIDLPPVSTSKSTSTSSYYYSDSSRTSRRGQEFYGIIVSVFNSDKELICQRMSATDLISSAETKMPVSIVGNPNVLSQEVPVVTFRGHRYQLMRSRVPYDAAIQVCERSDGHLVTIDSLAENQFLAGLAARYSRVWIGMRYNGDEDDGEWCWTTDEPVDYVNWQGKQPRSMSSEFAVALIGDGTWQIRHSMEIMYFICEWDK